MSPSAPFFPKSFKTTSAHVIELVKKHKESGKKVCVLLGAGVSKTAGIPLAKELIHHIKEHYPKSYERINDADALNYNVCMAALTPTARDAIINTFVKEAHLNLAHLAIASLQQRNVIDRILTTNFDRLALQACTFIGELPAVYDCTVLQKSKNITFMPTESTGAAIYHLHGQHMAGELLNTQQKLKLQADRLLPTLQEIMRDRLTIVCGYSGDNDPLVQTIKKAGPFPNGLIWADMGDAPQNYVRDTLFKNDENSGLYYLPLTEGGADQFFLELAQKLDCFPPEILSNPFQHLKETISHIDTEANRQHQGSLIEVILKRLEHAIEQDKEKFGVVTELEERLQKGEHAAIWKEYKDNLESYKDKNIINIVFNAGFKTALKKQQTGEDLDTAIKIYTKTLEIAPNNVPTLGNLGIIYDNQGETEKAIKLYNRALEIDPNHAPTLYNLSVFHTDQGETEKAIELCNRVLEIDPKDVDILRSLGNAYYKTKKIEKAIEFYNRALEIDPNHVETLSNLGVVYHKNDKEKAIEFYNRVLEIDPNHVNALYDLGVIYGDRSETDKAIEFYNRALEIDPNHVNALNRN